jgi:hypothetical protein
MRELQPASLTMKWIHVAGDHDGGHVDTRGSGSVQHISL